MSTRLLAELEKHIEKWSDKNCEESDWPAYYVHEDLTKQMALAAYQVFCACMDGQEANERNK